MYNLIEYRDNYTKTSGILWQYCKDIPVVSNNDDIVDFNLMLLINLILKRKKFSN